MRGTLGTGRHGRPRAVLCLALATAGVAGAAGCEPSTGTWLPGAEHGHVDGTTVQVGALQIRDLLIEAPRGGESYPLGGVARLGLTLVNDGPQADLLLGVETPIAGTTQLFADTTPQDPSYRPEEVPGVFALSATPDEPRETPLYVELRDLRAPAREGQTYSVTFRFARAGAVPTAVPVEIDKGP